MEDKVMVVGSVVFNTDNKIIPTTVNYKKATCRGSYALNSACGHCERCDQDPMNPKNAAVNATIKRNENPKDPLSLLLEISSAIYMRGKGHLEYGNTNNNISEQTTGKAMMDISIAIENVVNKYIKEGV